MTLASAFDTSWAQIYMLPTSDEPPWFHHWLDNNQSRNYFQIIPPIWILFFRKWCRFHMKHPPESKKTIRNHTESYGIRYGIQYHLNNLKYHLKIKTQLWYEASEIVTALVSMDLADETGGFGQAKVEKSRAFPARHGVPLQWLDDIYKIYIWLVVWLPCFIFPYIGNVIIPIDFHIFQRGGPTTNQYLYKIYKKIQGKSESTKFYLMDNNLSWWMMKKNIGSPHET